MIPTFLPVGTRRLGKALHRPVQILPGNVALTFADQINNPLMSFQVFTPHRGLLMTGRYAHANEGKKRQQNAAGMLQQKRIAGNLAKVQMKLKIAIQQSFAMTCIRGLAHSVNGKLQWGKVGLGGRRQAGCQSFERATKLVKVHYVLMAEMDDPGASSGLLGDKPLLSQDVDCFADRGLGDTEFGRPSTLNNPLARPERAVHDFRSQQVGKILFQKSFGRMGG